MAGGSLTKCLICGKLKIYGQECVRCNEIIKNTEDV